MIQVRDLSYAYAGAVALRRANLEVQPGEHLALVGANGSGKTTLARCLNGLLEPTEGSVEVDGLSPTDPDTVYSVRRLVGMVFQNPDDQLVATTVEAEIAFGMENVGVAHPDMVARVEELLDVFHLTQYRRHPPHQLSGGERQRLAVAACIALQPRYLILDEPTSLLDPRARVELAALLDRLRHSLGIATVHITQIPDEAARADRVVVLHRGEIAMDGPAAEVFNRGDELMEMGLGLPFALAVSRGGGAGRPGARVYLDLESLARAAAHTTRPGPPAPAPAPPALPDPPVLPFTGEPALLTVQDLRHVYDAALPSRREALCGIDMAVRRGRALGLLGASGSGKTTLAQHLNGLLQPTRGTVCLEGSDIWGEGPPTASLRRRVGLIFQFPELQLFEETVAGDVAFGPRNLGWEEAAIAARVENALSLVGLPVAQFGRRSPLALSGGERRRAAIAGVLAMDPDILVLDEPTAGLDPAGAAMLTNLLRHLRDQGRALVLISHDMDLIAELADDLVVLVAGRVALGGETRQVLCHPEFSTRSGLEPPSAVRLSRRLADLGQAPAPSLLTLTETRHYLAGLLAGEDDDVSSR